MPIKAEIALCRKRVKNDVYDPVSSLQYRWCVAGSWKLIVPHTPNVPDGQPELYQLQDDPHEARNLASSNPKQAQRLERLIDDWWPVAGATD